MSMKILESAARLAALLACLWGLATLGGLPKTAPAVKLVLLGVWIAVCVMVVRRWPSRRIPLLVALGLLPHLVLIIVMKPQADRAWSPDMDRTVRVERDGSRLRIHNIRNVHYRSVDDFDVRWETRTYDLNDLERLDLVLEHISVWRGLAHTLLSFGFSDGRQLGISVEIRRESGESFSPLKGALRHFELMYVVGDEKDLIGLRCDHRKDDVYVFPARMDQQSIQQLFMRMLTRAEELADTPEFYNTYSNTCTTNIVRDMEVTLEKEMDFDWRVLLPGYADALAWELDLVDFDGTLEEARARFLINPRSDPSLPSREWSRVIRGR